MKKVIVAFALFASGLSVGVLLERKEPAAAVAQGGVLPTCTNESGDVNGSGQVDLSDAVYILNYLFLGTAQKPLPFCSPAKSCALPATGQTKCYDSTGAEIACDSATCPGQDGFYKAGCPTAGRFVDNGDHTVTDHCTGLMWQKDSADVNGDGMADGLQWCDAIAYCENLSFAGHEDWRLPNVHELQSIVDYGRALPAIDPVFGVSSSFSWSSTSYAVNPVGAWGIYFGVGFVVPFDFDKDVGSYVRAVRNAP